MTQHIPPATHTEKHQHRFKATLTDGVHAVFRLPKSVAEACLPKGIETRPRGAFAYASVLIGPLQALRPTGVPAFEGLNDTIAVYSLLTQAMSPSADLTNGHWVMRMETRPDCVVVLREFLPQFPWQSAEIAYEADAEGALIQIDHANGDQSRLIVGTTRPVLPRGSSFPTPMDAQAFCRPPANLWSKATGSTLPWTTDLIGPAPVLQPTLAERVRLLPIQQLCDNCLLEWTQRITSPTDITLLPPRPISSMPGTLQDRSAQTGPRKKDAPDPSPAYA